MSLLLRRSRVSRVDPRRRLVALGVLPAALFGLTGLGMVTPAASAAPAPVPTLVVGNSVPNASSLTEYPDGATGNVAPSNTITGSNTNLGAVNGVATDPAGDIFVASFKISGDTGVFEFAPGATGNATPIAFLQGSATGLDGPQDIAIDASGTHLYVVNSSSVTEYNLPLTPAGATNTPDNAAPIATISGSATGLNSPFGITVDPAGDIFVANINSVTEYAPGANGNVAPIAVLAGSNTGFTSVDSVAVHNGVLFVSDNSGTVSEFSLPLPAGSTVASPDNIAPTVVLSGSATGLNSPTGMVFDSSGNLFVANNGNSSVTGYAPSQYAVSGSPTPYVTIAGSNTGLGGVNFIALQNPTAPTPLTALNGPLPTATVGVPYSQALPITGGTGPYTWSLASGSTLPPGLSLSPSGVLSGTPTTVGTTSFSVVVTDSSSPAQSVTENLSLTVTSATVSITTTSPLPAATVGSAYSETLAASGGSPPYTWTLTSGSLPDGLSLSAGGAITGTPTTQGTTTFTVGVSDSASPPSTATQTFSLTVNAPPLRIVSAVACPSASTCEAVGLAGPLGAVVPVINGVQGATQTVPGTNDLSGVACASSSFCVAVGYVNSAPSPGYPFGVPTGVVVPITNGVPGTPQSVPGTGDLFGATCASANLCYAVGDNSSGQGVVVPITNGIPGTPLAVPGTSILYGMACPTASFCVAVGRDSTGTFGVVVPVVNGIPGAAQVVPGASELRGVACPTASLCEAVGEDVTSNFGVVVPITNGVAGAAQVVPESGAFAAVACPTASICEVVGNDISFSFGVVAPITAGTPGSAQVVPGTADLAGIACPTTTMCVAGGEDTSFMGVVVDLPVTAPPAITSAAATTFTVGAPGSFTVTAAGAPTPTITETGALPAGVTFTNGVLSGAPASGTAGTYPVVFTASNGVGSPATQSFTLTVAKAATTTTVSASPTSPGFGTPVTFTATVAPSSANTLTPGGTVSFYLDGSTTPIATVALVGGTATFTTSGLGAGPHSVVAVYNGDTNFTPSTSAPATVKVTTTTIITGTHHGAVIVAPGTSLLLDNAQVNGAIIVRPGGSLDVENSTFAALVANGPTALRVCGSTAQGSLNVTGATGFVLIGDTGDDACAPNTIGGSLHMTNNTAGLEAIGNHVDGSVINTGNSGAGPFPKDTAPEVSGNGR